MRRLIARARSSDPETSHQAAFQFTQEQTTAQRSVLTVVEILLKCGPKSDFELRELWPRYWGEDKWSFTLPSKARHWAREAGLVKHDGYTEHEGRKVRRWAIGRDPWVDQRECCPTCGRPMRGSQ